MYRFTVPREDFDERNLNKQTIRHLILKHMTLAERLKQLKRYYEGQHKILSDDRKNRLVCNHAKDIADTASSYFIGNPVSYKSQQDISVLTSALEAAGADEADGDNGLDLSIYGLAYEYLYPIEGDTDLAIKNLSPINTFMVYDDTIEQKELFGVYYYVKKDDSDRRKRMFTATVLTQHYKYSLDILDEDSPQELKEVPELHYFEKIPLIEYQNNKLGIGDYELQIPLIDAYNALMSDRVTDKEQFIDAILALYGALLSDGPEYNGEENTAVKQLKEDRLLELPRDAKAEYLTRTFDESGVEILRKAIEQDIHKFSHIPCMSDEAFGGNVSGVAMEFKLLGMENITKIKTRYYKRGLRKRLQLFAEWLDKSKAVKINPARVMPTFTRALPKNLPEISQTTSNLWGKVSRKTLLSQIPFVEDVDAELKALDKETMESIERQKELFGNRGNEPPDEEAARDEIDE